MNYDYDDVIAQSIRFYKAQRSGYLGGKYFSCIACNISDQLPQTVVNFIRMWEAFDYQQIQILHGNEDSNNQCLHIDILMIDYNMRTVQLEKRATNAFYLNTFISTGRVYFLLQDKFNNR